MLPDTTPRIKVAPALSGDTRALTPPPAVIGGGTQVISPGKTGSDREGVAMVREDLYATHAVLGKIGDGGMGVVYLARDRQLGRHVAIKRLKPNIQKISNLRKRFLHEARAAASLTHPHIVHLYGLGEDGEGPYIVMEYVEGAVPSAGASPDEPHPPQTLEQLIVHRGAMPLETAIELLLKLCKAIVYAHGCGVIHRDLKPANILLDRSGEPKIVDFGLARIQKREESQLTAPGEKLLSLGYGAPEQESDASLSDERADVYGLGAILFFCLTSQNPRYFREEDLPDAVRPSLCKAMARDRDERWPDVESFAQALRSLQSGSPVPVPAKTSWRCKWCDTNNPVSTNFCVECGWDGGESCRECGTETHCGIPFCKTCGANARDYEQTAINLSRARQALEQGQYEAALSQASRAITMEPTGPNGRRMLDELLAIRTTIEKKQVRREKLREWIPMELKSENFERARDFIEELRQWKDDSGAFAQELAAIPELIIKRDLSRVRRWFREQDWRQAEHLLQEMGATAARNDPGWVRLVRQARRYRMARGFRRVMLACAGIAILYVLAAPPVMSLRNSAGSPLLTRLFNPAMYIYRKGPLQNILNSYASLWQQDGQPPVVREAVAVDYNDNSEQMVPAVREVTDHVETLRTAFEEQVEILRVEFRNSMAAWPLEYRRQVKSLRDRHQAAGDFGAWRSASLELSRFEASGEIVLPLEGEPEDVSKLKQEFLGRIEALQQHKARRLVNVTKKFLNELNAALRDLTRAGEMAAAEKVASAIEELNSDSEYVEAERLLAAHETSSREDLSTLLASATGEIEELRNLRNAFEDACQNAEDELDGRLEKWTLDYLEDLRKFMEDRLGAGDYQGYESAKLEIERFELHGTLTAGKSETSADPLAIISQSHAEKRSRFDTMFAENVVSAAEAYAEQLNGLITQYTKSRNLEAAAAAAAELRRLRDSAQYLRALEQVREPGKAPQGEGEES